MSRFLTLQSHISDGLARPCFVFTHAAVGCLRRISRERIYRRVILLHHPLVKARNRLRADAHLATEWIVEFSDEENHSSKNRGKNRTEDQMHVDFHVLNPD